MKNIVYDTWMPYTEYEKAECDIKLKNGKILYHMYPNAGFFNSCCGPYSERRNINEVFVAEIMYRHYYRDDLCKKSCNQPKV